MRSHPITSQLPAALLALLLAASPVSAAMTHLYTFNNGTAKDSVGSINGTLMNGATITSGSLVFSPTTNDGVNANAATGQYLSFSADPLHTADFSIVAWTTWGGGNIWQRVFDEGNAVPNGSAGNVGNGFIMLTLRPTALGQFSLNSWGGSSDTIYVNSSSSVTTNVEHMLVYTHTYATGTDQIYIDGQLKGSTTSSVRISGATTNYSHFYLGRSQFDADPFFKGSIDEFRTYDNVLSTTQIAADYAAGPTPVPEPASLSALAVGMVLFVSRRPRRSEKERKRNN